MPIAPSPISLSFKTNTLGQMVISWFASPGAVSYNIYGRSNLSDGFGPPINITPIIGTSFIDTAFVKGTVVYYTVTSVNSFGESLPSATLQVSTVIGPVVPRVDFHQTKFTQFIEEKGYRLRRENALHCPCNIASKSTTDATDLNCPLCKNKKYIYSPGGQMAAILSNMTQENSLEQSGQWLAGMYKITTKPQDQLGLYDRLIFLDDSVSFTEALSRTPNTQTDQLRFPAISFDLPIEDIDGVTYVLGTDFSIDGNGNIVWGLSSKQPSNNTAFGVRYQTLRRILVIDFPHVSRASFLGNPPVYEPMSLAAVGKLEFLLE
jgi:hypothetical protein